MPEGNEILKELCATMSGSGQFATMSGSGKFGTIETSVSRMNSLVSAECSSTFSVPCDVSRKVSTGTSFSADLVKLHCVCVGSENLAIRPAGSEMPWARFHEEYGDV